MRKLGTVCDGFVGVVTFQSFGRFRSAQRETGFTDRDVSELFSNVTLTIRVISAKIIK